MMQMNLDLAPPAVTMVSQAFDQRTVVLLCWIEISVNERASLCVAPLAEGVGILAAPFFQSPLLLRIRHTGRAVSHINGRLKMISQGNDQMRASRKRRTREPLPGIGR